MSFKESVRALFKSGEAKEAENFRKTSEAHERNNIATEEFLEGQISVEEYNQILKETYPLTRIDLRKLATGLKRK